MLVIWFQLLLLSYVVLVRLMLEEGSFAARLAAVEVDMLALLTAL